MMVPHSLHVPEQLISQVHAVFRAIDKPPLELPGSESPIAFTPPAEHGQWRSSENFLCRVLPHRKPAAALAEVAASLRNRLISICPMAGGLVIRLLPQSQRQAWMWSSLPATGLQSAPSRVNVRTTCLGTKLCATHCLCQLLICRRSTMRLLNCQHDCSRDASISSFGM